jgi:hypothetical protein
LEDLLDRRSEVNWDCLFRFEETYSERFDENYFTYYVLNANMAIGLAFCGLCFLLTPVSLPLPWYAWCGLLITIAVFGWDGWRLREKIAEISRRGEPATKAKPHEGVLTRLKGSSVHGVGVFAISKIAAGTSIFPLDDDEFTEMKTEDVASLPVEIRRLYRDFAVVKDGGKAFLAPPNFNRMPTSWFLNDSKTPNVRCDSEFRFFALRDIEPDEELTVDYDTYSERPPE